MADIIYGGQVTKFGNGEEYYVFRYYYLNRLLIQIDITLNSNKY